MDDGGGPFHGILQPEVQRGATVGRVALDKKDQRVDAVERPVRHGQELQLGLAVIGCWDVVVIKGHGL